MAKIYCTTKNTSTSKGHPDSLRPKIQQFHTFKYLMFHYIINNLTQRGKVKNNKNLNYPQRKIVQEHRNKTTKVINHSQDKDHISGGKRTKGKPAGFKPPQCSNSTEVHQAAQRISNRHRPSLTQGINAINFINIQLLFT